MLNYHFQQRRTCLLSRTRRRNLTEIWFHNAGVAAWWKESSALNIAITVEKKVIFVEIVRCPICGKPDTEALLSLTQFQAHPLSATTAARVAIYVKTVKRKKCVTIVNRRGIWLWTAPRKNVVAAAVKLDIERRIAGRESPVLSAVNRDIWLKIVSREAFDQRDRR